jgi:hypothetical protein
MLDSNIDSSRYLIVIFGNDPRPFQDSKYFSRLYTLEVIIDYIQARKADISHKIQQFIGIRDV